GPLLPVHWGTKRVPGGHRRTPRADSLLHRNVQRTAQHVGKDLTPPGRTRPTSTGGDRTIQPGHLEVVPGCVGNRLAYRTDQIHRFGIKGKTSELATGVGFDERCALTRGG